MSLSDYGTKINVLGEGGYAKVYLYQDQDRKYAVKRMKYLKTCTEKGDITSCTLREIICLKTLQNSFLSIHDPESPINISSNITVKDSDVNTRSLSYIRHKEGASINRFKDSTKKPYFHPNIVQLIDVIQKKKYIALVMPVADKTLNDIFSISKLHILEHIKQLVLGLDYIHKRGFIHRDINPRNILVFKEDSYRSGYCLKIADFGLSRFVGIKHSIDECRTNNRLTTYDGNSTTIDSDSTSIQKDKTLTLHDTFTQPYKPPEVILEENYSFKADIWSLGCTILEIYNIFPLFDRDYDEMILHAIYLFLGTPQGIYYIKHKENRLWRKERFEDHKSGRLALFYKTHDIKPDIQTVINMMMKTEPEERANSTNLMAILFREDKKRNWEAMTTEVAIINENLTDISRNSSNDKMSANINTVMLSKSIYNGIDNTSIYEEMNAISNKIPAIPFPLKLSKTTISNNIELTSVIKDTQLCYPSVINSFSLSSPEIPRNTKRSHQECNIRKVVFDWIDNCGKDWNLSSECIFTIYHIFDLFTLYMDLSLLKDVIQRIACGCIAIATKLDRYRDEVTLADITYFTNYAISIEEISTIQLEILKHLDYNVNVYTIYHLLKDSLSLDTFKKDNYISILLLQHIYRIGLNTVQYKDIILYIKECIENNNIKANLEIYNALKLYINYKSKDTKALTVLKPLFNLD